MDESEELRAWMLLLRTPGMGPCAIREALAQAHGSARAALGLVRERSELLSVEAGAWLRRPDEAQLRDDLDWLAQPGHRLLRCTDLDFPPLLQAIPQPPAALFITGAPVFLLRPQVAVVGARQATTSGRLHAKAFASELAKAGFIITSGMAEGVDGAAHEAALEAGLPTVAVVGTGVDRVYPRKHLQLARRIAATGALVSEFPLGTPARADHFPRRNRLLSGLALGTLVVEADLQSGSLISARLAGEQGREVFALPGSIHNPLARGCHQLIRDGARLVECAREIVEQLAPLASAMGAELAERLASSHDAAADTLQVAAIDPAEAGLLEAMGHDPVTMDELVERTGHSAGQLTSLLLMLELADRVESLPGNRYVRLTCPAT